MAEKKGSGCLKIAGYACLGAAILGVIAVIVGLTFGEQIVRIAGAKLIEVGAKAAIQDTNLPQKEQDAILEPILELTADIREDRVSKDQLEKIGQETFKPTVLAAVGVPVFKSKYLNPSGLSAAEKQSGAVDLERFATGIGEGKISKKETEKLSEMLTEESKNAYGSKQNRMLKKTLTDTELRDCLTFMRDSANQGKVSHKPFNLDPAKAIRDAIARGKAR